MSNSKNEKEKEINKIKKIAEKDKDSNHKNDITYQKDYKIPDVNNKKYFDKINKFSILRISKFLNFFDIIEVAFVYKTLYELLITKYKSRLIMIKEMLALFKENIKIKFSEDFKFYLQKNSSNIRELNKKGMEKLETEYYSKMKIKQHFFSKINFGANFKKLYLNNSDIGKRSMKYLSYYLKNPKCTITEIDISSNKITKEVLRPLESEQKEFEYINAEKCMIDGKTLNILSNIKTKKLNLSTNNIDNELISKLSTNNISELNLSNNLISNMGVYYICINLKNLTKLNLSCNNICDVSLVYLSLYFKTPNCRLTSLNLKDNKITITGMITLISTLNNINKNNNKAYVLKKLNLSKNLLDYIRLPKRLGTDFLFIHIEKLSLRNHTFHIDDLQILFDFINNIKDLKCLDLSKNIFPFVALNLAFNRLSENTSLKRLKLNSCYIGNTEVNNSMENYSDDKNYNKNIINEEKDKEDIKDISNNNIFNEHLSVESLDLAYNFINYKKLDKIIIANNLKELNIEGNDLNLWGNDLLTFFEFIIKKKFLEKLNLSKNNLQNMANQILEKLSNFNNESNCSLKFLSLEENKIQDINLVLTTFLINNKNLEVLNLKNNLINDDIGNNYFFHGLFKNTKSNLKELDLSNNKLDLKFLEKLINYSKENKIEKKDFLLNVTSKELREAYLKENDRSIYWELLGLNCITCF